MTTQVASARIGIVPQSSADRAQVGSSLSAIRGMGAARALYGFVPLVLLMNGSDIGTGVAGPALLIVGLLTLLQGAAVVSLSSRLVRDDAGVLAAVLADAMAVVAGIALTLLAWDQFSVAAATVVIGAVVVAVLSMVAIPLVAAKASSGSARR
ncbi:hypothetical protein [Nocardia caishijiensis]|uniref:Integral membrane protein n=1 Tax=Nocardia caishijiensis TaxID=184756 RepID=A0ABQ6YHK6_9NOCA|nr:hypothetical protein [Nocardia caishijiensis]KAF0845196.1 hypothetical protein FNL39_1084 [Nocardia caishijiensis]